MAGYEEIKNHFLYLNGVNEFLFKDKELKEWKS